MRLIGPPGMFVVESYRKKMLCRMSEDLAKLDPALRYALPCAFSGPRDEQGAALEALLRSQAGRTLTLTVTLTLTLTLALTLTLTLTQT